jgi:hypothetical protein
LPAGADVEGLDGAPNERLYVEEVESSAGQEDAVEVLRIDAAVNRTRLTPVAMTSAKAGSFRISSISRCEYECQPWTASLGPTTAGAQI